MGTSRRKRRVELVDTGEVLTSDDVLERIQKADAERASKRAKKISGKTNTGKKSSKTKKSESTSESRPESDSIDVASVVKFIWMMKQKVGFGCDRCELWWHYWSAGLDQMLDEEDEWFCQHRHDS